MVPEAEALERSLEPWTRWIILIALYGLLRTYTAVVLPSDLTWYVPYLAYLPGLLAYLAGLPTWLTYLPAR